MSGRIELEDLDQKEIVIAPPGLFVRGQHKFSLDGTRLLYGQDYEDDLREMETDEWKEQVRESREFIRAFMGPRGDPRRLFKKFSSYTLKHRVEEWTQRNGDGIYVPSGATIRALLEEGYRVVPESPSPYYHNPHWQVHSEAHPNRNFPKGELV